MNFGHSVISGIKGDGGVEIAKEEVEALEDVEGGLGGAIGGGLRKVRSSSSSSEGANEGGLGGGMEGG